MTESGPICTFTIGDYLLGVEARAVAECTQHQCVTRVPLAAPPLCGVMSWRGQIVPVVDLRRCFELDERTAGWSPLHLIVTTVDGPVGLAVDDIGNVLLAEPACCAPMPPGMPEAARALIRACYALGDRSVLLLLDSRSAFNPNTGIKP